MFAFQITKRKYIFEAMGLDFRSHLFLLKVNATRENFTGLSKRLREWCVYFSLPRSGAT